MERILSFDLSTKCIGVVAAVIDDDGGILKMKSIPIIPPSFSAEILGFLKSKRKILTKNGTEINSYVYKNETTLSIQEKKKRDVLVRHAKNKFVLKEISKAINIIVEGINPTIILVEKNEIFNGILTSVLLAEVRGILLGIANSKGIDVRDFKVNEVRKILNKTELIKKLVKDIGEDAVKKLPDVTKSALRKSMQEKYGKYGLQMNTDDEGDACVVLNYFLEERKDEYI